MLRNSILFVCLIVFTFFGFTKANPLTNTNVEAIEIYDNALSTENSKSQSTTIKPFSGYKTLYLLNENIKRVEPLLNIFEYPDYYIKPLNSFETKFYITNEENTFLEGQSGLKLRKGLNLFLFEDGLFSLGRRAVLYYQFRQEWNRAYKKIELFRGYLKFRFYKFSLELGKDNVNLGPGEYSVLLSNNAPPFPMVKIQTEEPFHFLGKWDFLFLRGWLIEDRKDVDNPNILALRVVWKPADWLEIGGTKTTLYGGEGRPGYSLKEYWDLITSSKDNIPGGKFDNESLAGIDLSLYLPIYKWLEPVNIFKFYIQQAGTDIAAIWQEDDDKKIRLPYLLFKFERHSLKTGVLVSTKSSIYRLELVYTGRDTYRHHNYPQNGYTYKGLSLGYPYGRNIFSIFFKHRKYINNNLTFEYKVGFYRFPYISENTLKFKRYFAQALLNKKLKNIVLEGFFRIDKTDNYDIDPSPIRFNMVPEDKLFYILGFSFSYRF